MLRIGLGGYGVRDTVAIDAASVTLRNAIPFGKRKWGMMVTVYADANPANNIIWYLKYNNASTNKNDNNNWVDLSTVVGGGSGSMVIKSSAFDASPGNFPLLGVGVLKGWCYIVSVFGTLNGIDVYPGTILIATANNPGNTWAGGWNYHS
ncbi:hypothetical protein WSM22_02950 [Cytophagales bacterium WSM2-2]|nr:hypothetical protein WSM22_02950 [Cytophagales bacterium WSM2-2]